MTTETRSKILLSILIAAGASPAIYFFMAGLQLYAILLLLAGIVLLYLIWRPRRS